MLQDLLTIGFLVLLEGALSADNALVLAILVRHLPRNQQKNALLYGLGGAFVFRAVAILAAKWILSIWWLQGVGALYLAYLAVGYFVRHGADDAHKRAPIGKAFWPTVIAVELADLAFAVDSILVAVAVATSFWVMYTGAMLGILGMRIAAAGVVRLLHRYPQLESMAYVLIGWIAVKLGCATWDSFTVAVWHQPRAAALLPEWLFWLVMALILTIGSAVACRRPAKALAAQGHGTDR